MTFLEALAATFESNQHIRRRLWSKQVVVGVEGGYLCIKGFSSSGPDDGKWHQFIISESDYFADDWEVIE